MSADYVGVIDLALMPMVSDAEWRWIVAEKVAEGLHLAGFVIVRGDGGGLMSLGPVDGLDAP